MGGSIESAMIMMPMDDPLAEKKFFMLPPMTRILAIAHRFAMSPVSPVPTAEFLAGNEALV
jgi:hypothetical protein